jgi:DNA repair protein RadA/Sms
MKFTSIKLDNSDVYINISRGLHITEPGIDLASIAALISGKKESPLGKRLYFGEVSLT